MIKFFRKIRQRLLEENRMSKYLIYAIGEIVLVVIGILIALQINNWNEGNKQNKQELKQLKALKLEFEKNLISFDSIMLHHTSNQRATVLLMNAKDKNYSIETLDSLFLGTIYNYNFDPSTGIYNSIINSGQIDLISSEPLKYKIAEIQDLVIDYIDDENMVRNFCNREVFPFVINRMPYNPMRMYKNRSLEEKEEHRKLFEQMLDDRVFIEHISLISLYREGVFEEGIRVRRVYQEIIHLIGEELKELKI